MSGSSWYKPLPVGILCLAQELQSRTMGWEHTTGEKTASTRPPLVHA